MPAIRNSAIVKLYQDTGKLTDYTHAEPIWSGTLAAFKAENRDGFATDDDFYFEVIELLEFHGFARFGGGAADATILIAEMPESSKSICDKWVARLGLGFHPDTRGADYTPALSTEWLAEYETDMETLFADEGDPYAFGLAAMHDAGLIEDPNV